METGSVASFSAFANRSSARDCFCLRSCAVLRLVSLIIFLERKGREESIVMMEPLETRGEAGAPLL